MAGNTRIVKIAPQHFVSVVSVLGFCGIPLHDKSSTFFHRFAEIVEKGFDSTDYSVQFPVIASSIAYEGFR